MFACASSVFDNPSAPPSTDAVPIWTNVVLLLHGEGSNGGTSFTDSSSYGHTTASISNLITSTAHSRYGSASIKSESSSATGLFNTSTEFDQTNDYTLEFSLYADSAVFVSSSYAAILSRNNSKYILVQRGSGGTAGTVTVSSSGMGMNVGQPCTVMLDQWADFCFVRSVTRGFYYVYVNGVLTQTQPTVAYAPGSGPFQTNIVNWTGGYSYGGNGLYIDEVRWTKNQALHWGPSYALQGGSFPNS